MASFPLHPTLANPYEILLGRRIKVAVTQILIFRKPELHRFRQCTHNNSPVIAMLGKLLRNKCVKGGQDSAAQVLVLSATYFCNSTRASWQFFDYKGWSQSILLLLFTTVLFNSKILLLKDIQVHLMSYLCLIKFTQVTDGIWWTLEIFSTCFSTFELLKLRNNLYINN